VVRCSDRSDLIGALMASYTVPAVLVAAILCVTPAAADSQPPTGRELLSKYRTDLRTLMYLNGLVEGMSWGNFIMHRQTGKKFYCVPERMSITVPQAIDIIDHYLKAEPNDGDHPLAPVLVNALMYTFPCT
jgi:hypothetical protein